MKKNKVLLFTKFLYGLSIITSIVSIFIVYKNIDNDISYKFLVGYVMLAFFMLLYVPFITIMNARKFKWVDIRRSIFKFTSTFVLFSILNYAFDYMFRPSEIDLFKVFSTSLGISFSLAFIDITFAKEKQKSNK